MNRKIAVFSFLVFFVFLGSILVGFDSDDRYFFTNGQNGPAFHPTVTPCGNHSIYDGPQQNSGEYALLFLNQVPYTSPGVCNAISVSMDLSTPTSLVAGIYADNGSNSPSTLIVSTGEVPVTLGWNTYNITPTNITGPVWEAYAMKTGHVLYETGLGSSAVWTHPDYTYNGVLPSTCPPSVSGTDIYFCIYLNLCVPTATNTPESTATPTNTFTPTETPIIAGIPQTFTIWTTTPTPVIAWSASGFDDGLLDTPSMVQQDQLYIAYTGWDTALSQANIGLVQGADFSSLTKQGIIMAPGGASWKQYWVSGDRLFVDPVNQSRWLFYEGGASGGYEGGPSYIGAATATDWVGPYTDCSANPLISPVGSTWKSSQIFRPDVFYYTGLVGKGPYFMAYNASDGVTEQINIAQATTECGPWTDLQSNPVFTPPQAPVAGQAHVFDPQILIFNTSPVTFAMVYSYANTQDMDIAYSTDLINWTNDPNGPCSIPIPTAPNGPPFLIKGEVELYLSRYIMLATTGASVPPPPGSPILLSVLGNQP